MVETPAQYRRRIGLPYDPWIDPYEPPEPCAVCAAAVWTWGCPACGRRPTSLDDALHPVTNRERQWASTGAHASHRRWPRGGPDGS